MERAACRDSEPESHNPAFFSGSLEDSLVAFAMCVSCPVRSDCLRFAVETGQEHGTWGGVTEDMLRLLVSTHGPGEHRRAAVDHGIPRGLRPGSRRGMTAHNASKTHCKRGHAFDKANTYRSRGGRRQCLACRQARNEALRPAQCPAGHPYDQANTLRTSHGRRMCRACQRRRGDQDARVRLAARLRSAGRWSS